MERQGIIHNPSSGASDRRPRRPRVLAEGESARSHKHNPVPSARMTSKRSNGAPSIEQAAGHALYHQSAKDGQQHDQQDDHDRNEHLDGRLGGHFLGGLRPLDLHDR